MATVCCVQHTRRSPSITGLQWETHRRLPEQKYHRRTGDRLGRPASRNGSSRSLTPKSAQEWLGHAEDNTGVNVLRPDHLFRLDLAAERAHRKLYDADSSKGAARE